LFQTVLRVLNNLVGMTHPKVIFYPIECENSSKTSLLVFQIESLLD
jgi:hypothetical protein